MVERDVESGQHMPPVCVLLHLHDLKIKIVITPGPCNVDADASQCL